ncbi:MAG: hypothetical protein AABM29_02150 [Actinomycetota bacterium]
MLRKAIFLAGAIAALLAWPASAAAWDPITEAKNFSKINEREIYVTGQPGFQQLLVQRNLENQAEFVQLLINDPERNPIPNICANRGNECAGDVRFYDFGSGGFGIKQPVLFTGRSGATLSGTIWATSAGPQQRPGVVITTGSVQAPETLYWGLAATLAKAGYVVLTYDVQGQGRSDTFGADPDEQESVPAQDGQPFWDSTEDALDFLLSNPNSVYAPRPSCSSGTSHAAKQERRVNEGFNTRFNPLHGVVDPSRVGVAGHSFGAAGISYVGQKDPRVDALVAWDNLNGTGTTAETCPSAPATRTPTPLAKPALGMSADYFLVPEPYPGPTDPAPDTKNTGFNAYDTANVDSMQVNIRGGTHYEFSFLPGNTFPYPFGTATFRGIDMVGWYTMAWLDKYVNGADPTADARLLTDRWCDDALEAAVDPDGDGNMYSFYFDSPTEFDGNSIADLRAECTAPGSQLAPDGGPANFNLVDFAHTPDSPGPGMVDPNAFGQASRTPCAGAKTKKGTRRDDRLKGGNSSNRLRGRRGNDRLRGRGGNDCLYGGKGGDRGRGGVGNDYVNGQRGPDNLRGGRDRDVVTGMGGRDRMRGGAGNDLISGGAGTDHINSRDGELDVVDCGSAEDLAVVDAADQVSGCETVSAR